MDFGVEHFVILLSFIWRCSIPSTKTTFLLFRPNIHTVYTANDVITLITYIISWMGRHIRTQIVPRRRHGRNWFWCWTFSNFVLFHLKFFDSQHKDPISDILRIYTPGVPKWWPAGQIRPARRSNPAHQKYQVKKNIIRFAKREKVGRINERSSRKTSMLSLPLY